MNDVDRSSHDPVREFERRLARRGARPPATPPDEAARRVLARLEATEPAAGRLGRRPPGSLPWLRLVAAAALLLAAVVLWRAPWHETRHGTATPAETVADHRGAPASAPLPEGVMLLWIDEETPLYLSLAPPPAEATEKGV